MGSGSGQALDASGRGARELAIAYQHDRVVKVPARSISKRQFLMKSVEHVEHSVEFFFISLPAGTAKSLCSKRSLKKWSNLKSDSTKTKNETFFKDV